MSQITRWNGSTGGNNIPNLDPTIHQELNSMIFSHYFLFFVLRLRFT